MREQSHEKMKNLTLSAMFAAVIMLMILYLFHIPVGSNGGYIHFGDAAIGGGLADIMSGSAIWAIPTMIIKPLTVIWFTSKEDKLFNKRNIVAVILAGVVSIVGYYLAQVILTGNWVASLLGIWGNIVQAIGSGVIFLIMAVAIDKVSLKKRLKEI